MEGEHRLGTKEETAAKMSIRKYSDVELSGLHNVLKYKCLIFLESVTHSQSMPSSLGKNWFGTVAQACVSWPIRVDWMFSRSGLKETGGKTEHLKQRGNTVLHYWLICFLSNKIWNPLWIVIQNKTLPQDEDELFSNIQKMSVLVNHF